jgi:putative ABC transport system substrate-binding protein
MRRRVCLAAAGAWTLQAAAQAVHGQSMPRIGVLSPTTSAANQPRFRALTAALADLGYEDGRNLSIEYRFAEGRFERLPELARELAALPVRVIIAINTPAALAAAGLPGATPVLFASVGDPLAIGLVPDLSRPGGKVTGTTNMARDLSQKRMQLLREMLPDARRLAVLTNPGDPIAASQEADVRAAAPALGFELRVLPVRDVSSLPAVLRQASEWPADAVLRIAEPLLTQHRVLLAQGLLQRRLPAMMVTAEEVRVGGLMSYFGVEAEEYRALAAYVDRVLKGASPADLPVQQPTRFALVINLGTARQLGLAVPTALRLRADEVVE